MSPLYTATVEVSGGRAGRARSRTGSLEVTLTRPAERGPDATGTDPDDLKRAVATADTLRPCSNAVRGNTPVEIRIAG